MHRMASRSLSSVFGVDRSLSGKSWKWRGGNMDLGEATGALDDVVTQLLLSRGVLREDLERHRTPTLRAFLPDPSHFRDMDVAAERIAQAVMTGETVTIYGDYDVDGATSAALLVELLRQLGLDAGYYIPDRLLEGYGPSGEALVRLGETGSTLVVTVDCGAMAHEALGMARDAGVDVIVVDHHKCSPDLPPATALVNPNRLDESDLGAAHGHLAAVGVAFLLGVALVRTLRGRGWFAGVCVLGTRCSCFWFALNRHLHSRKHSWRCPGRRRAGFPSHLSSELCMTGARPQIHRSRQERLCALFLLPGCVASCLFLLPGSSSSCTEDRKKRHAYAPSRPPADRAHTGTLEATMPGTRVQVGTAPFANVVLAAPAF